MSFFVLLIIVAVPSYILGSVNGAIITSKNFFHKDIRKYGSGNPGLTNFYRVFGKSGVLLVLAVDIIKTAAPVLLGGWLFGSFFDMRLFGREFAGLFVMLGHCYPVFYGFVGGKGVMAAGTVVIIVDWRLALACWGVFIIVTALTRYVSLGAIMAGLAYPVSQLILFGAGWSLAAVGLSGMLLIGRHKDNIGRLIRGEESKFSFHRRKE